jgi:hypothetical protein
MSSFLFNFQDKYKHHLETSREKLSADWKKKFDDLKAKQNRALEVAKQEQEKTTERALAELRQTLEEEKEAALRALVDKSIDTSQLSSFIKIQYLCFSLRS